MQNREQCAVPKLIFIHYFHTSIISHQHTCSFFYLNCEAGRVVIVLYNITLACALPTST